jgi:MFS family permease
MEKQPMTTPSSQKILTRDFVLGFLAQLTFMVAFHILVPTLPIYLSRLGSKEAEIGVLIGAFGVSSLLLRPFVGRGLSKINEKTFMLAGAFLFSLTSFAYLLAPPFLPFLMVRVFQGMGLAFFNTASFTLIANISPESHRGQSLSYFFLAQNVSLALAPAFGMFLINRFSFTLLFLVCSGVSLLSLLTTTKLEKRQAASVKDPSVEDSTYVNWKALPPSIISFFSFFIWGAITTFFPLYAISHGVANPGFFFTAIAITLILGRTLGGRILDLYSREKVILYFLTLGVISMVLLSFSKTLTMFIVVGMIWGIGAAFIGPALMAYTVDRAGPSLGPAMGTFTALSDLGVSLGPVMMGFIIRLTSYPVMFLCLALMGVISMLYFGLYVRK